MREWHAPEVDAREFSCPLCGVYAMQMWDTLGRLKYDKSFEEFEAVKRSRCYACDKYLIWVEGRIVDPPVTVARPASPDLPDSVTQVYNEAAAIASASPRAAAALLRLAVELLCRELGEEGKLDQAIANLVKRGLPTRIQRALDVVRVTGNNAIHAGKIDVSDRPEAATALFGLVNAIAYELITHPREIDAMYEALPETVRESISERDAKSSS
jgi:hypothetical protein